MELGESLQRRIPYLVGAVSILYMLKPSLLFKPNGKLRNYGVGYDEEGYKKTLYTFHFCIIILVIFIHMFG